jgi:NTP pyrophosphatase (non-canonical NTP hydrolase)
VSDFNSLAKTVFENAQTKGWWQEDQNKWSTLVPEKIALMHSELSEALEEYRNGYHPSQTYTKEGKPEGIPIEMADLIIRALDFCHAYGIDIDKAIETKMAYNATRPYKHGGKKI